MYFRKGKAKIELAVAKGKKQFDKRAAKKEKNGIEIKQDMLENQANIVYLSIGSNLGNRVNNIEKAKSKLIEKGIEILSASSYYETFSWPDKNKPKFYNIVLKIKTTFNEIKLLKICKEIEKFLGEKNAHKLTS